MAQVLRPIHGHRAASHANLLVGMATRDDAGVFLIEDGRALVQTVDFFAPIVDDPYDWGRIAAANALSDVYAMGARPLTALQLVGWPRDRLSFDLAAEVVKGGAEVMAEARTTIVGGHSIDNEAPIYGFSMTGTVDPARMVTNATARPGDLIVLTKPLGAGVVATGVKLGRVGQQLYDRAVGVMATLNGPAAEVMVDAGVRSATDVTGYGLLGHLREMVDASGVSARLEMGAVPVMDGVPDLVEDGVYPGGSLRNLRSVRPILDSRVGETDLKVLADAQTSGGLLMAVPSRVVDRLVADLAAVAPAAAVIGEITADRSERRIEVV